MEILDQNCRGGQGQACAALAEWLVGRFLMKQDRLTSPEAKRGLRAAARGCDLDVAKSCQTLAQYQRGGFGMPVDTALAARTDERAALLFGQACESGKLDECLLAAALTKDPDDKKRYLDVPMNAGVGELEKALRRKLDATPEL